MGRLSITHLILWLTGRWLKLPAHGAAPIAVSFCKYQSYKWPISSLQRESDIRPNGWTGSLARRCDDRWPLCKWPAATSCSKPIAMCFFHVTADAVVGIVLHLNQWGQLAEWGHTHTHRCSSRRPSLDSTRTTQAGNRRTVTHGLFTRRVWESGRSSDISSPPCTHSMHCSPSPNNSHTHEVQQQTKARGWHNVFNMSNKIIHSAEERKRKETLLLTKNTLQQNQWGSPWNEFILTTTHHIVVMIDPWCRGECLLWVLVS